MGWVYNLKDQNAPTHAPRMIAILLSFTSVACIAVLLRFYVRLKTKRAPWIDDYATLCSAILDAAYSGIAIAQTRWGQALDPAYFPPENIIPFSKVQYAGGPVYTLALLGFKVALLTSYLRIGSHVKAYRYAIYGVTAACVCNQIIFTLVITLACHPVSKQWNFSEPGWCIDTLASYYAIAGTSLGFDLIIIALPLPVIWKLQLKFKQKVVLCCLFALGFFITVIQIFRIFTIANLKSYTDSEAIVVWSCVEISLAIIISCVPTYGPLFRSFSANISGYRSRRRDQSYKLGSQTGKSHPSGNKSISASNVRSQNWAYDAGDVDQLDDQTVHTTIMTMKHQSSRSHTGSEEHILPMDAERGSDLSVEALQIHTTTEVKVETRRGP